MDSGSCRGPSLRIPADPAPSVQRSAGTQCCSAPVSPRVPVSASPFLPRVLQSAAAAAGGDTAAAVERSGWLWRAGCRLQEAGLSLGRTSAGSGAGVHLHTNPRHVLAPAPSPLLVSLLVILSTSQPPS